MRRPIALSIPAALVVAAPALAQGQATTPAPPPPPPPPPAKLTVIVDKAGRHATVLAGQNWRVRGDVTPYVAGQQVVVRLYRDGRRLLARRARVTPAAGGAIGHFRIPLSTNAAGSVTIRVTKAASAAQPELRAPAQRVTVLPDHVGAGATGNAVRVMQRALRSLGYVPGQAGVFDARTERAVLAFRKVSGLPRTTAADRLLFSRMADGGGRFKVRYPEHGRHVEADLSLQVIALIDNGEVQRIYPASSGKPSTPTVVGHYRFYSKTPGYNAHEMYYSNYFVGGYAIHGYYDVPAYSASHGCLRIPIPDAVSVYRWVRIGDRIDVYP